MALVIVLGFVVLVTGLFVAFLSRSLSDTQLSNGSANLARVNLLADGAVNSIVGDLQTEIAAGSDTIAQTPAANANSKAGKVFLPSKGANGVASQPFVFTDIAASAPNVPLVKRSARGHAFFQEPAPAASPAAYPKAATYPASNRAAASATTATSLNGRSVSAQRWNKPLLFSTTASPPDVPAALVPDWIVVARDGSNPTVFGTAAARKDATGNDNPAFAVGRYAYMMYDEGALLDANAAGSPTFFNPAQVGAKGSLPLADLTRISMTQAQIDTLVGWRNAATAQTSGSLGSYTFGGQSTFYDFITGGSYQSLSLLDFLSVAPLPPGGSAATRTDRMFTGRQDLINFLLKGVAQTPADQTRLRTALMNLGTFTRERNAPSWMPPRVPLSLTNPNVTYASEADKPASLNRNVANVVVPAGKTFKRKSDGLMALPGEPLVKHRFPLALLDAFNHPTTADSVQVIHDYFSMRVSAGDLWNFIDIDNGDPVATAIPHIKTLDEVAQLGTREPTYWELLQAAILTNPREDPNGIATGSLGPVGSLGVGLAKRASEADYINNNEFNNLADLDSTRQLFAIGLSIIDQYDTNDDPTVLIFKVNTPQKPTNDVVDEVTISGVENLPYLFVLGQDIMKDKHTTDNLKYTDKSVSPPAAPIAENYIDGYLLPLMWNPHRNAAALGSGPSGWPKFRIRFNGKTYLNLNMNGLANPPERLSSSADASIGSKGPVNHVDDVLVFQPTGAQTFERMAPLTIPAAAGSTGTVVVAECTANALYPPYGLQPTVTAGFFMGQLSWPSKPDPNANFIEYNEPVTYSLEKQNANGNWLPYLVIPRFAHRLGDTGGVTVGTNAMDANKFDTYIAVYRPDPRTARWGAGNGGFTQSNALRASTICPWDPLTAGGVQNVVGAGAGQWMAFPVLGAEANPSALMTDNDGVQRKQDGESASRSDGSALAPADRLKNNPFALTDGRPVVLNRAFTSVSEMGYAFRDQPWKSVDFASAKSADAALLDFFTVNNVSDLRAGVFNPNNASAEALSAVLRGAYQDPLNTTSGSYYDVPTSTAVAKSIYAYLHPSGSSRVLANRSDLTALVENIAIPPNSLASSTYKIKASREALVRALSDAMNTRTWNLFIDVVAQTGRYSPNTPGNGFDHFLVEGERRVWVHLAIDRYTGEVVERQVEPVSE